MSRPSVESTLFRARRRLSEEYEELVSGERCRRIQAIIAGADRRPRGHARRAQDGAPRLLLPAVPARRVRRGLRRRRARPEAHRAREDRRAAAAAGVPQAPHRRPRRRATTPRRRRPAATPRRWPSSRRPRPATPTRRCTAGARPRRGGRRRRSPASAPAWRPTTPASSAPRPRDERPAAVSTPGDAGARRRGVADDASGGQRHEPRRGHAPAASPRRRSRPAAASSLGLGSPAPARARAAARSRPSTPVGSDPVNAARRPSCPRPPPTTR